MIIINIIQMISTITWILVTPNGQFNNVYIVFIFFYKENVLLWWWISQKHFFDPESSLSKYFLAGEQEETTHRKGVPKRNVMAKVVFLPSNGPEVFQEVSGTDV